MFWSTLLVEQCSCVWVLEGGELAEQWERQSRYYRIFNLGHNDSGQNVIRHKELPVTWLNMLLRCLKHYNSLPWSTGKLSIIYFPTLEVNGNQKLFGSSTFFKISSFVFNIYRFEMIGGWVHLDKMFIFGGTISLKIVFRHPSVILKSVKCCHELHLSYLQATKGRN